MGRAKLSVAIVVAFASAAMVFHAGSAQSQHASVVFTDLNIGKAANGTVTVSYGITTESWNLQRVHEPKFRFEIRHDGAAAGAPTIAEVPLQQYGRFDLPVRGAAHLRATVRTRNGGSLGIRINTHGGPMTTFSVHTDWLHPLRSAN